MTVELFGTCADDCAHACDAAESYRSTADAGTVVLLVALALFLLIDALIACASIYQAGMRMRRSSASVEAGTVSAASTVVGSIGALRVGKL